MPPTENAPGVGVTGNGSGAQAPAIIGQSGYLGKWINVFADAADLGIISGASNASVSGANAPVLATVGVAGTAGVCDRIPAGQVRRYFVTAESRYLGVVGSAAGTIRISPSSRPAV